MNIFDEDYLLNEYQLFSKTRSKLDFQKFKDDIRYKWNHDQLTPAFIKSIFDKIYREKPEKLIDDIPSIGEVVRLTILVGIPLTINPFIAIFTLIADRAIKESVNAKFIENYIKQYKAQLRNVEMKISKERDRKKLDGLYKLKTNLELSISKLEEKKEKLIIKKDEEDFDMGDDFIIESINFSDDDILDLMPSLDSVLDSMSDVRLGFEEEILSEKANVKEKVVLAKDKVNKVEKRMDTWFDSSMRAMRKQVIGKEREQIISNGIPSLSKIIRKAVTIGAAYAINPALAAITLIVTGVLKKGLTAKEKSKILRELKQELEITEEKIKDADASGDRDKKYQLMRIKNKLTVDIERIKGFY